MLPSNSKLRKNLPITTGVLDYFPDALAYVALVSKVGNDKHNPGQPMHWARGKSDDHEDCIGRHLVDRRGFDDANVLHAGSLAWRALANLQLTIEGYQQRGVDVFDRERLRAEPLVPDLRAISAPGTAAGEVVTINEDAHGNDHHDGRHGEAESEAAAYAGPDVRDVRFRAA